MVVKLPYSLHTRYRSIAIAWTVILIPPTFINLGLFYGLWFGTNLDRMLGSSPSSSTLDLPIPSRLFPCPVTGQTGT